MIEQEVEQSISQEGRPNKKVAHSHPLRDGLVRTVAILLTSAAPFVLTGCNDVEVTNQGGATTQLKLLDVTTAAAAKTSKVGESFWGTPNNLLIRCYNTSSGALQSGPLNGPRDCEIFPKPAQISPDAELLAVNKGAYQESQTVWLDKKTQKMTICSHDESFWSRSLKSISNCEPLNPPKEVNPKAVLVSINSGTNQEAQSFWVNPNNSVTACTHDKQRTGFLGWLAKFGAIRFCEPFTTPTDKFPKGVDNPVLSGVTSDDVKPGETFWQDKKGIVVRCENQRVLDRPFLGISHIGPTESCNYWPVFRLPQ